MRVVVLAFPVKHDALALHTPPVAAQLPIRSHDAMARHHHGDRVRRTGSRHGPRGSRLPDRLGDLSIRAGLSVRNLAQGVPHPRLEGCRLHVDRQVEAPWPGVPHMIPNGVHGRPEPGIRANEDGPRVFCAQLLHERRVLAEVHRAYPTRCGSDKHPTDRTIRQGVYDLFSLATAFVRSGRHAELLARFLVQSTAGSVTGVVHRPGHAAPLLEPRLEALETLRSRVLLGAQAGGAPEHALEVRGAEAHPLTEFGERGGYLHGI